MTDPREEFSPFWPQSVAPFAATPQPPGSLPRLAWEFPRINQALLALWDSSKIPIPPAQAPWFPPATPPTPAAGHLDSANDWGAMPETPDAQGQQQSNARGLLYSFSQPYQSLPGAEPPATGRGILGSLSLPNNPWLGQPTSTPSRNTIDAATSPSPSVSVSRSAPTVHARACLLTNSSRPIGRAMTRRWRRCGCCCRTSPTRIFGSRRDHRR
jgi:hypothetical protein